MLVRELTAEECREVLARMHLGRLGCARRDQPYVVPIHFSYDASGDCAYAFSTVGQKVHWMRDNPKICLEVEEIVDRQDWTTVLVTGRYEEIQNAREEAGGRARAAELFEERGEWWQPAAANVPWRGRSDIVIYRIRIDHLTGRRTRPG
jgi:nitroimidazol reductase NimA-like FMN-containing flavoprotein (pyridoxamine 5'-phosphate oxidase superfamily)